MENLRRNEFKVLLGNTKENSLVFANIHLPKGNRNYFSTSFYEVSPFEASEEYLIERLEEYVDGLDKESRYDLCERYDCSPCDLEEVLYINTMRYDGVEGIVDISLYSESFRIDGLNDDIYFKSDGCGQHDTRNILNSIDKDFSTWLHDTWDNLHLKEISDEQITEFEARIREYENKLDEESWIQNWLEELYQ